MTEGFKEALNKAVAELCGRDVETRQGHTWKLNEDGERDFMAFEVGNHNGPVCERCGTYFCEHCRDESEIDPACTPRFPKYCTDRNALPEVWASLKTRRLMSSYMSRLCLMLPDGKFERERYITVHTADLVLCCIAALRAVDKWTPELEEMWRKEQGE